MSAISMRRPRVRVPVVALAFAALLLTLPRPHLFAQRAPERVAIIDLRAEPAQSGSQSRSALIEALSRRPGIVLITDTTDPDIARALAGELSPAPGEAALAEAAQALAGSDCSRTLAAAGRAITELSAAQAAGTDTAPVLQRAYAHWLVCAHQTGDTDAAVTGAQRLRDLGADAPVAPVTQEIWNAYPQVDAVTDRGMVQVTIGTEPAGGEVWLDHRRVGPAPVTVVVSEGLHMIAAGQGPGQDGAAGAQMLAVTWKSNAAIVNMVPRAPLPKTSAGDDLARMVARWRQGGPDPAELGAALTGLGVRFAVILTEAGQVPEKAPGAVEVWALAPGETVAKRIAKTAFGEPDAMARAVRGEARRWNSVAGPEPGAPLLREGDVPTLLERHRARSKREEAQPWWVYALVISAVAVAGGAIIADLVADDHQRIEVMWPPPQPQSMQPMLRW